MKIVKNNWSPISLVKIILKIPVKTRPGTDSLVGTTSWSSGTVEGI